MSKLLGVILFAFGFQTAAFSQHLDKICPVYLKKAAPGSDASYVLTASDYNFFRNKPSQFENSIQIIDADQPWPPRWFSSVTFDSSMGLPYAALVPLNASYQNQKFSYFTIIKTKTKDGTIENKHGFIICDSTLTITDTLIRPEADLDHHDFQIRANGEKIFLVLRDTVVNMNQIIHNGKDTAVTIFYEVIEVTDSLGRVCFTWDPFSELGPESPFKAYLNLKGFWNRPNVFDWSHGNSVCFDYDGNILYSYKFIGIGKISRKDGLVMWRVDRNRQQLNFFSDPIPVFLQHDLKGASDLAGNHFYSFLSNGDPGKLCSACQFTVEDTFSTQKVFSA